MPQANENREPRSPPGDANRDDIDHPGGGSCAPRIRRSLSPAQIRKTTVHANDARAPVEWLLEVTSELRLAVLVLEGAGA